MAETTLHCDQAIFTSTRTPMGEGYRIIAASPGLRPEEKQAITQKSPSHDGLCIGHPAAADTTSPPIAAAFFPLSTGKNSRTTINHTAAPFAAKRGRHAHSITHRTMPISSKSTGRYCVALSTFGGAEHTGRGGQRIYTHNIIFDGNALKACSFNPFQVLRAMVAAGLSTPQLKPPSTLPSLELCLVDTPCVSPRAAISSLLEPNLRMQTLAKTLEGDNLIVNLEDHWLECGEALMMGIPGPLRLTISLSVGIRFSLGRHHQINLSHEDKTRIQARVAGQGIHLIDSSANDQPINNRDSWLAFVEQQWAKNNLEHLAQRTGRDFADCTTAGRNRIAGLFELIDGVSQVDTGDLITSATARLSNADNTAEGKIAEEFLSAAQRELCQRFTCRPWCEIDRHWPVLVSSWRSSTPGTAFAWPIIEATLRSLSKRCPLDAFEAAITLAAEPAYDAANEPAFRSLIDEVVASFDQWISRHNECDALRIQRACAAWLQIRPACPILGHIDEHCRSQTCPG